MIRFLAVILASAALSSSAGDFDGAEYPYPVPLGLRAPDVPEDNPVTDAKVELGRALYFDKRLSRDGTVSCASCHAPEKGWTDQAAVSTGIKGQKGGVSAPTVLNSAYMEFQFWDGRAKTLEEQAKGPIQNPIEMGFTHDEAVARLRTIRGYAAYFKSAFGDEGIDIDRIAKAIATFERTVLTGDAPYDRWFAGDKKAMSASAARGHDLFHGKASCAICHDGFNFSNSDFHNIGVGSKAKEPSLGRFGQTKDEKHRGAFKTPTLRNLKHTAPYMHDGSEPTLEAVIDYYDRGGEANAHLDGRIKPLKLTAAEKKDLVAFMDALNGDPAAVKFPKMPE